ncbi:MFS transporter [Nocardia transvalensis]|uniref:MFS transporter n=1 Tax=Nocardia transvalensis TaxID=37333 RepID=UPI0018960FBE|nr:MFS transporter [Nocardia transvalensis]MBF6327839.1 MFS transporter [Nocardia transvalensis]
MQYRVKVAFVYLLGFFIDLLNMFIANIAYPDIGSTFHAGVRELTWVGNAYLLGLTVVIPLSVWLAARFGDRRVMVLSLSLFALASLAAGFAGSLGVLIAVRFVQGAAGGLLIPVGQAMTYRHYPASERAGLASIIMCVALIVPATSPTLGGILVDHMSWRWIFWLNIPLAVLDLLLALWWLRPDDTRTGHPFDTAGFALGSAAIAALLVGLSELGDSGGRMLGAALLVVAAVTGALFVRRSSNVAVPLLKLGLLKERMLATSMVMYHFVPGIFTGTNVILIIYLQQRLSLSATATGMLMIPWAVASALAIVVTRAVFNRVGPKLLFIAGMLAESVGLALLFTVVSSADRLLLIGAFVLMGLGGSLTSSAAQSAAFLETSADDLGHASALWNINRQASFAVGVAVVALVFDTLSAIPGITSSGSDSAFRWSFIAAAVLTLLPAPLVLRLAPSSSFRRALGRNPQTVRS